MCYAYTNLNGRQFEEKGEYGYEKVGFRRCYDDGDVHVDLLHVRDFSYARFR